MKPVSLRRDGPGFAAFDVLDVAADALFIPRDLAAAVSLSMRSVNRRAQSSINLGVPLRALRVSRSPPARSPPACHHPG